MKKSFLVLFTSFIVSFIAFYIIVKQDFKLAFIVALLLAIAITQLPSGCLENFLFGLL